MLKLTPTKIMVFSILSLSTSPRRVSNFSLLSEASTSWNSEIQTFFYNLDKNIKPTYANVRVNSSNHSNADSPNCQKEV